MLVAHFWMGGLTGGYVTHGECYRRVEDKSDDILWWGKGGTLKGQSPPRITFFDEIMEDLPITEMVPTLTKIEEGKGNEGVCFVLAKPGHIYLGYTLKQDRPIGFNLTGNADYKIELIDTWNMTVQDLGIAKPGKYTYKTTGDYQAVRATRK